MVERIVVFVRDSSVLEDDENNPIAEYGLQDALRPMKVRSSDGGGLGMELQQLKDGLTVS